MSFRDTASRKNGDSRPIKLNNSDRTFLACNTGRVRSLGVSATGAASTIDLQVNGASVLSQGTVSIGVAPAGVVPINTFARWEFGSLMLNPGDVLTLVSSSATALGTVDLMLP